MPPNMPGMYYDVEKGRYMRILPDHVARNMGSSVANKVSNSAVRAEGIQKQREKRRKLIDKRRRLECIQRSNVLSHDLGGRRMCHELARTKEPWSRAMAGFWLQGMEYSYQYYHEIRTPEHIRDIVRCPRTGNVYMASDQEDVSDQQNQEISTRLSCFYNTSVNDRRNKVRGDEADCDVDLTFIPLEEISSMHLLSSRHLLLTSLDGGFDHFILDPDSLESGRRPVIDFGTVSQLPDPHSTRTFWASQPSSTLSAPLLAVASSHGLFWFDYSNLHHSNDSDFSWVPSSEVLSVAWTSPQVIAGGCRNGTMILADTRVKQGGHLSKSVRLQHGTSIMRLKRVDEWRVLSAGPKKMSLYDLRFPTSSSTLPKSSPSLRNPTKPYMTYPSYVNDHFQTKDLDVSLSLGMIASATNFKKTRVNETNSEESYPSRISYLDLWTGKSLIPEPPRDGELVNLTKDGPSIVKFFYSEEQRGGMDEIGGPPLGMLCGTQHGTLQYDGIHGEDTTC